MHRSGDMGDPEVTSSTSLSAKKPKNDSSGDNDVESESLQSPENFVDPSKGQALGASDEVSKLGSELISPSLEGSQPLTAPLDTTAPREASGDESGTELAQEEVELKITFNKSTFPVCIGVKRTIGDLKKIIESSTGVSPALQKIVIKGIPPDETTISSLKLAKGAKIMVIGTKLDDVLQVTQPVNTDATEKEDAARKSADLSSWSSLPQHRKIIEKGVPDDAMAGILNEHEPLPGFPLHGMLSSKGAKVRLTFKLTSDELWIGTKERTDKVPIQSIRNVTSQPITGYEHYHIMAIQLGPTEASRLYIYWVPAQYVEAIKTTLST